MELKAKMPNVVVSVVHPGVVQTDFGRNALHTGGPDNRTLPNSQTAEEVATVIADAITFGAEDMAAAEAAFGPPPAPR